MDIPVLSMLYYLWFPVWRLFIFRRFYMKKSVLLVTALVSCVLMMTGCPGGDTERDEPTFLAGKWTAQNAQSGMPYFTITKVGNDYTFECHVIMPLPQEVGGPVPAKATGKFDYTAAGLGPNDYILRNMTAATGADPDATYITGNAALASQIGAFNNILITLAPNAAKTQFTFTSADQTATTFFGSFGEYIKQPQQ